MERKELTGRSYFGLELSSVWVCLLVALGEVVLVSLPVPYLIVVLVRYVRVPSFS